MRRTVGALAVGLLLLGGCAPMVQSALTPAADFAGPAIQDQGLGRCALVVTDGARLPCLVWSPDGAPHTVVVALHGMNDSKAAFRLAGPWWAERGIETWAYDQRGFGQAPGRGVWAGEALLTDDLRSVVALVRAARPGARVVVAGESMGGAVAIAAFASERPPDADGLVLMAPAVWGWSSQSPLNRASLWVAARALGSRAVQPPDWAVRDIRASDHTLELLRNARDPAFATSTRFDALSGLVDLMETATCDLGAVRVPTLLQYGSRDQIITKRPMRRALERAQATGGERPAFRTAFYEGHWHLLNRDLGAEAVYADVAAWLADPGAPLPSGAPAVLPELTRPPTRR